MQVAESTAESIIGHDAEADFVGDQHERRCSFRQHSFKALNLRLDVLTALKARRPSLHVAVTGRNAKPELIAAADLVTEMTLVKHHFAAGVKAQPGIEF